jgi:hypothetical protein
MVVVGLFILWILDQVVYQRLLNAIFVTGLYKEAVDPKVDPIRVMMVIGSEYKGMSKSYDLFYFIPMMSFNLFSAGAWILENIILGPNHKTNAVSSTIGMIVILMTASIWTYIKYKRRKNRFSSLLKPFSDKDFENIGILKTSPQKCFEICAKWAQSKSRVSEEL